MLSRFALVGTLVLSCCASMLAQQSESPEPYTEDEAYRVYEAMLPHDSSTDVLVIQQRTHGPVSQNTPVPLGPEGCLTPEAASEFKDAITDYDRLNHKQWLLQKKFALSRPYELMDPRTMDTMFRQKDGWDQFARRFPNSDGIYDLSAVGFNQDKTRAIVYFGKGCGWLCGSWDFHLLRKISGEWKDSTTGVMCHTVS